MDFLKFYFIGSKSFPDEDRLLKHLFDPDYQPHNLKTAPISNINDTINVTVGIEIRKLIALVILKTFNIKLFINLSVHRKRHFRTQKLYLLYAKCLKLRLFHWCLIYLQEELEEVLKMQYWMTYASIFYITHCLQTLVIIYRTRNVGQCPTRCHPAEYRWRPLFNAAKFG